MALSSKEVAKQVIDNVGGLENISGNATCMTRLHVTVVDTSKVNVEALKKIEGVMGVVEGQTVQIVFGPGKVNKIGLEFSELTKIPLGSQSDNVKELAKENKRNIEKKQTSKVQIFLKHFANIFVPLLPGIIAAGMINGITNVINVSTKKAYVGQWWYALIMTLGWALFLYLPIFVGMNAAKEFKGSAILGAIGGALSVSVPAMPLLAMIGEKPILLPITNQQFAPAAGGLLAALFTGIFFAYLERFVRKYVPEILDTFLTPLITVIVGGFVSLLVIQPFGSWLNSGIYSGLNFIYTKLGVIGAYILSSTFLPIVSVGLHRALTPIHAMLNDPNGPTKGINYLLPILMMAGGGQVGAGFALYLKTRSEKLKSFIRAALPVGILGIGEPLMYAVTLPLLKPFITACLGAGLGGIMIRLFKIGTISQGVSGLFGLLIVVPGQQLQFIISMLAAYTGGFVLTWLFGIEEDKIQNIFGE
ncbi:PTS transporter subunit EIIC [Caloramator sp. E03]|uniref:PTS transporter subunit EIIC n=1 Tax=Caloramator sp. E03 TaxID=2576307 RepID=UPI001A9C1262|nr:PTS transporter subunit EIIC [Caloramator sp. E03]